MFSLNERDMILFAITESVRRISSLDMDTFMVKRLATNIFRVNISLERIKIKETNVVIDYIDRKFRRLFYDVLVPTYMKRETSS